MINRWRRTRQPRCNICRSSQFEEYGGRPNARCVGCDTFERHRVCYAVYQQEGLLGVGTNDRRVLHISPEHHLHRWLQEELGEGYVTADSSPERYAHAKALRLELPGGLEIFPQHYFDFIIHNHVWEHIPGSWKDHIEPFVRVLQVGGKMLFTFPYSPVSAPDMTEEGGELLPSDEDRLARFGQKDHVRRFGKDFVQYMSGVDNISFRLDGIPDSEKATYHGTVSECGEIVYGDVVFIVERTA